jgi:hypothetical protein
MRLFTIGILIAPNEAAFFKALRYECRLGRVCYGFKRAGHLIKRAGELVLFVACRTTALSMSL